MMNNRNNVNYLNNINSTNNKNSYVDELIYLYNQKLNGCNNNNLNCFNIKANINNICKNNNVNTTMNVNNIPLLFIGNSQLNDFQLKKIQENRIKSNLITNLNFFTIIT